MKDYPPSSSSMSHVTRSDQTFDATSDERLRQQPHFGVMKVIDTSPDQERSTRFECSPEEPWNLHENAMHSILNSTKNDQTNNVCGFGRCKKRKLPMPLEEEGADENMSTSSGPSPARRRRRKLASRQSMTRKLSLLDADTLPISLQQILNEEMVFVTNSGFDDSQCGAPQPLRRLHSLPASVTVQQVLDHFEKSNYSSANDESSVRREFCRVLETLFHEMLVHDLLYPEEVPQYQSLIATQCFQHRRPSEVYGCSFLLRLLVRLPQYTLPHSSMSALVSTSEKDRPLMMDLLALLQKNRHVCFQRDAYRTPTYDDLLDWERALPNGAGWIYKEESCIENCDHEDESMALATPKKRKSED